MTQACWRISQGRVAHCELYCSFCDVLQATQEFWLAVKGPLCNAAPQALKLQSPYGLRLQSAHNNHLHSRMLAWRAQWQKLSFRHVILLKVSERHEAHLAPLMKESPDNESFKEVKLAQAVKLPCFLIPHIEWHIFGPPPIHDASDTRRRHMEVFLPI